ncbi:MAG TPA: acyloxyacyl hydrolase [Stellaceae bacterium]|nr:acyloxyacyl hydrolase [Stellaceae bacterium]
MLSPRTWPRSRGNTRLFPVLAAVAALHAGAASGAAQAGGLDWIDEGKLGVLAHDVGFLGHHLEDGTDLNGELLFASPGFLSWLGAPRPHIGGTLSTDGNTSYGYFGLTWSVDLWHGLAGDDGAAFVAGSLGGGVHDGYLDSGPSERKLLGSRILFRESVELGYRVTSAVSISVMLDHLSNAGIASHNQGLTNVGLRTGYRF